MKNHYEMYQSLLSRYDAYQEKKQRRMRIVRRTVPVAACFCFTVVLGLGVWHHNATLPNVPVKPEVVAETTTECSETTAATEKEMPTTTTTTKTKTTTAKITETQPVTTVSVITQTETNPTVVTASIAQTKPSTVRQIVSTAMTTAVTVPVTSRTAYFAEIHTNPIETTVTSVQHENPGTEPTETDYHGKPKDSTDTEFHGKPTETTVSTTETVTTTTTTTETQSAKPFYFLAELDVRDALQAVHDPNQQEMVEELTKDGYIYQPVCTDAIALKPYSAAVIFPHSGGQDTMIQYEMIYQDQEYRVSLCCADSQIADNWDGMSEYLQARFGRTGNWGLSIRDQVYCIYNEDADGVRQASVRLDQTHYLDVSTTASEEEMIEFLKAFQYEQIPIQ